jgi:NAD(P)-dependent dehydrogenase (short-subunit alcohol dehydrogenase family)
MTTINAQAAPGAVLVTGASTGIGRATALTLSRAGFHVFAGVRRPTDATALLTLAEGELTPVLVDVTDQASIDAAVKQVADAVGDQGLAGLVNNAGIAATWPMEAVPLDDLRWQYEVNVFGQVAVTQAFLPLLRRGHGRLINIGSIGDRITMPFGAPLTSSKWAFASITEALRVELRPWGIDVVLIEPGSIRTEAVDKVEADAAKVLERMDPDNRARYGEAYRSMTHQTVERSRHGSSPDGVGATVLRALTARRPHTRYLVGKEVRVLAFLAKWAPDRLFDRIKIKIFRLPQHA